MRVPVYKPDLSGNESAYVNDCMASTWISSKGKYIEKFERAFGEYLGMPYCASVSSGTAALQVAMAALGLGPGDEVIVPTFTYVASVNPITATGARSVFVDSLRDCWQMDPEDVSRKVTDRTRAIVAVHLYGGMCDMARIMDIAGKHNLLVIEDCAEAFGSRYEGRLAGTFGDVACFSFYGNKTITSGEGGMVVTGSPELYRRVISHKGQGLAPGREYWHDALGFNYRMTNICAAIGLAQLERADKIIQAKRDLAEAYRRHLEKMPLEFQGVPENVFHTHWMVSVLCGDDQKCQALRAMLKEASVETRPLFPPVHTMPIHNGACGSFPCSQDISARGMNLPSWPGLREEELEYITAVARKFFDQAP